MTKKIQLIIIIIFIAALAVVGYVVYKNYKSLSSNLPEAPIVNNQQPAAKNNNATTTPKKIAPQNGAIFPGFKLYKNSDFGFEIQYPESWTVSAENIVNVRGENTKGFFFKKPGSDLRFAVLPKDGLSYGLPSNSTSEDINIGGLPGVQTKYIMADGRRLLLVHPQTNMFNWDREIGRLDIESGVADPVGDFVIFTKERRIQRPASPDFSG